MTQNESAVNNTNLAQSDVREVLQYVPIFRGQTFLVALDGEVLSDTVMAEVLLDLISLQNIGVQLVLSYVGQAEREFLDWAAEVELKVCVGSENSSVESILSRGQAAFIARSEGGVMDGELVDLAIRIGVDKILYLGDGEYTRGLERALNVKEAKAALEPLEEHGVPSYAIQAVQRGVKRVHLLDGNMLGCLSRELFSNEGVGVMIYADSYLCLLYTSPSPRDGATSRMPSSA